MDLHGEDTNISTFRRGNKIIAVGLAVLFISLTLLILTVASIVLLPPILSTSPPDTLSVESFCAYSNTPMCITALNSLVTDRFATDSNQIVALCIQTAAKGLQNLITAYHRFASNNCSDLREGSDLVRESVAATARAKRPFVGWLSAETDEVVIRWLMAAEEGVHFCLRELAEAESPEAVAEMTAKLEHVNVYLYSAYGFILNSGRMGGVEPNNGFYIETSFENLFGICLCGVQLFMFGFVCSLFRNRSSRVSLRRFFLSFWNTE